MTWTSRSFFSDRVLSGGPGDARIKEVEKLGLEVLSKLVLCANEFIKKYSILYTVCKDQQKATAQWDKVSRKLIKQCRTKGTKGTKCVSDRAHSRLGPDTQSPLRGKS